VPAASASIADWPSDLAFSRMNSIISGRRNSGPDTLENTCLACAHCNGSKGSNVAGYDFETDRLVALFNPRLDGWDDHFSWQGPELIGKTAVGRATIDVLRINHPDCIAQRQTLIEAGLFPPEIRTASPEGPQSP
jgi:hypothetical protein